MRLSMGFFSVAWCCVLICSGCLWRGVCSKCTVMMAGWVCGSLWRVWCMLGRVLSVLGACFVGVVFTRCFLGVCVSGVCAVGCLCAVCCVLTLLTECVLSLCRCWLGLHKVLVVDCVGLVGVVPCFCFSALSLLFYLLPLSRSSSSSGVGGCIVALVAPGFAGYNSNDLDGSSPKPLSCRRSLCSCIVCLSRTLVCAYLHNVQTLSTCAVMAIPEQSLHGTCSQGLAPPCLPLLPPRPASAPQPPKRISSSLFRCGSVGPL